MRRSWVVVFGLAAALLAPGPLMAQRTTGSIVGTVTDDTGSVLPGVTVEVSGSAIVGTQTSVTNERGFYRFPALPPGEYDVVFRMSSFATLRQSALKVGVGQSVERDISMKLSQLAEEITVTGEAPVVDTESSKLSTNYDKEWVKNAPIPRFTFFDLINAAPGVNQSNSNSSRSTSLGSGADENSYQLDGTDFTAPFTGAAWPWPNTDAIEEIEILSLGAPAEYGNVSGAVFNVVTRQGSNEFHGDFNYYSQYQGLTSSNTSADQDDGLPFNRDKYQDFTAQLAGPVIKDKLWFLASYQYQRDNSSQPGVDPNFPTRQENDRIFAKLNWQINSNHKLMFAIHNDYYFLPYDQTAAEAPSTIGVESGDNPSPNLTYTGILSDKTYIEARVSGFFGNDHADPLNGGPRVAPRFYNLDTGDITGGTYFFYDSNVFKESASVKVSHFADDFLGGSHDFKFGVQWSRGGVDNGRYGANDFIYTYEYGGQTYGYGYSYEPVTYGGIIHNIGAFFDDTFRVNDRLTLSLGARFDNQRATVPELVAIDASQREAIAAGGDPQGDTIPAISDLFSWNNFSPRLGFNLKLTADGKTVLRGHYGRYYRQMVAGEYTGSIGTSPSRSFFGTYDPAAGGLVDLEVVSESSSNFGIDPSYSNPYTDQFAIGIERELLPDLGLSLNYTKKRGRDYPAWNDVGGTYASATYIDDQGAEASGASIPVNVLVSDPSERFFEITNDPRMKTDIDAFTAQLVKRMSHNWQSTISFSYVKSEGQLPSGRGGPQSAQNTSLAFSSFGQNPNDFVNGQGRLTADRPVSVKVQLVYELPAGFLVGANYNFQSGRPWARRIRVPDTGLTSEINAEVKDGSRRVSDWNVLDFRLSKRFNLTGSGDANVTLFADVLNVFNDDANEDLLSRLGTSSSFGVPAQFLLPRRVMVGGKLTF